MVDREGDEPSHCPRCGDAFGCGVRRPGCWCGAATLSGAVRDELAQRYEGCLCPTCLDEHAAPVVPVGPGPGGGGRPVAPRRSRVL